MLCRVAESLYWLARYIERAENNARILDVNLQVTLDDNNTGAAAERVEWEPILATLEDHKVFDSLFKEVNAANVCEFITFTRENPNSIASCVAAARENARTVREYISSEMWERINHLFLWLNSPEARHLHTTSGIEFYRHVVDCAHQFLGTTAATLTRGEGWNFIQLGKYLERADSASRILDLKYHILLPDGEKVGGNVDTVQWQAVLKSCSAFEAYRKIHPGQVTPWTVAEFIILHDSFPRSIRFCATNLDIALHRISGCDSAHFSNEAERRSGRLVSDLNFTTIDEVFRTGLHEYLDGIQGRLNDIATAMHREYCAWLEEAV
jgi:uncharacterized alpha-E superfamily protein